MGEIVILGVFFVLSLTILGVFFERGMSQKYGKSSDMSELSKKVDILQKHVDQANKDQLHERVSRVEAATGVKLF